MSPPTSLTIREARANIVFDEVKANLSRLLTIEDVRRLPRFTGWTTEAREAAIGDLVHDGRLYDDEHGRVCIRPWRGVA